MKIDSQADLLHDDDTPTAEFVYRPARRRFTPADSWQGIQEHDDANRIVNNNAKET